MSTTRLWQATETNRIARHDFVLMRGGPAGARLRDHAHPELQITLRYGPENEPLQGPLRAAQVSLWAPHQSHAGGWPSGWEVLVVHLGPRLLAEAAEELMPRSHFELRPMRDGRDGLLEEAGRAMLCEFQSAERRTSFYMDSLAAVVAGRIVRAHGIAQPSVFDRLSSAQLAGLGSFIQRKIETGFTVAELAGAAGLPSCQFAARLRLTTHLSPWAFVQSYRISLARRMLRNRRLTVAEIANALGFSSQSHFTNSFRKTTGSTPAAYRKNL